jgi:hypothetical protein
MIYLKTIGMRIIKEKGEMGIPAMIAGLVLLAAYMMYPEVFHSFFEYVQDLFFQNLDSSFEDDPFNEGKGKGSGKGDSK